MVRRLTALFTLLVLGAGSVHAQSLMSGQTLTIPYAEDERRADELRTTGERREGRSIVLFTPAGTDDAAEDALLKQLDKGITALHEVVGRHEWQVLRTPLVTVYASAERFDPHAYGRGVFVPLHRLHEEPALVLHEAAHEVLRSVAPGDRVPAPFPFWLTEGLAERVASEAAGRAGPSGETARQAHRLHLADAQCAAGLDGPHGGTVASHIGGAGAPSTHQTPEEGGVTPLFRACATSFVNYLVRRVGLSAAIGWMPLVRARPDAESFQMNAVRRGIEQATDTPLDTLRAEWRASLRAQ